MQDWKGILIRMKRKNKIKYVILAGAVSAVVLSACSHGQTADITAAEQSAAEETQTTEPLTVSASEAAAAGAGGEAEEGGEHTLDGSRIIAGQSFDVTWKNWGDVRFVSYAPPAGRVHDDAAFYLTKNDEILYKFPQAWDEGCAPWTFESVDMVSFRDIDGDGNEDVIAILSYITGAGPQAAVPFPTTRIFMGDGTKFVIDTELSEAVDEAHANENISTIMDFIKNRTAPVKGEGADKTAEAGTGAKTDSASPESGAGEDKMYEITGIRETDARAFLKKFVGHVKAGEKAEASRKIAFPRKVILPDQEVTVESPEAFLTYYDEIFTEDFKERLSQFMDEDSIWWNYRGVAVGNGEIWLNESDGALWIVTLNSAEDRTVLYPGETGIQAG